MRISRLLVVLVGVAILGGCPGGKGLPGGGKVPGGDTLGKVPGVPGGGNSGLVDPNSCGNYAAEAAGKRLKAFLVATQELEKVTKETAEVVKNSCKILGTELGMADADYGGSETKQICGAVFTRIQENLKVSIKGDAKAAFKVKYKPAVCKVSAEASVKAAAECEGKASADFKATCEGTCSGKCDGTCSTKGAGGDCNGQCSGSCGGKCSGTADVNASVECKASASVKASLDVECTPPELTIDLEAKLVVKAEAAKAEATLKALRAGLPEMLSVKARLVPMKFAVETWAKSAASLKDIGIRGLQSFKDQATCIGGQIAAAAGMVAGIQANVSVSVEFTASASGTIGAK